MDSARNFSLRFVHAITIALVIGLPSPSGAGETFESRSPYHYVRAGVDEELSSPVSPDLPEQHQEINRRFRVDLNAYFGDEKRFYPEMTLSDLVRLQKDLIEPSVLRAGPSWTDEEKVDYYSRLYAYSIKKKILETAVGDAFTAVGGVRNDGNACVSEDASLQWLSRLGEQAHRTTQEIFQNDIAGLCRDAYNGYVFNEEESGRGVLAAAGLGAIQDLPDFGLDSPSGRFTHQTGLKEMFEAAENNPDYASSDPWMVSVLPSRKLHEKMFRLTLSDYLSSNPAVVPGADPVPSSSSMDQASAVLSGRASTPFQRGTDRWVSSQQEAFYKSFTGVPEQRTKEEPSWLEKTARDAIFPVGSRALCLKLDPWNANSCAKGVEKARASFGNSFISMPELFEKVLTDDRYEKGLRSAALVLIDRMKNLDREKSAGNHFDEDLRAAFLKAGATPQEAKNRAWDVLGLIATAGPNLILRLDLIRGSNVNEMSKFALHVLAVASAFVDNETYEKGRPYSLPAQVRSRCNDGKSYHFWMAAYLARSLAKELDNPKAAASAVFLLNKGYQFMSRTSGRFPERYLSSPSTDLYNIGPRIDLAKAAAGVAYGSGSSESGEKSRTIELDEALKAQIKRMRYGATYTYEEAGQELRDPLGFVKAYWDWDRIYSPDSAFHTLNR